MRPTFPMQPEERLELVVLSQGGCTALYVCSVRGDVVGVLDTEQAVEVAREILMRRDRMTPTPFLKGSGGEWQGPKHSKMTRV